MAVKEFNKIVQDLLEKADIALNGNLPWDIKVKHEGFYSRILRTDPWIHKYKFPNSLIPSANQITKAFECIFKLEDWHNFGPDYDKTLMSWHTNFNNNWERLKTSYNLRIKRMWNYYLLCCAGSFRVHKNRLWQIVLSKIASKINYESIRHVIIV